MTVYSSAQPAKKLFTKFFTKFFARGKLIGWSGFWQGMICFWQGMIWVYGAGWFRVGQSGFL